MVLETKVYVLYVFLLLCSYCFLAYSVARATRKICIHIHKHKDVYIHAYMHTFYNWVHTETYNSSSCPQGSSLPSWSPYLYRLSILKTGSQQGWCFEVLDSLSIASYLIFLSSAHSVPATPCSHLTVKKITLIYSKMPSRTKSTPLGNHYSSDETKMDSVTLQSLFCNYRSSAVEVQGRERRISEKLLLTPS